MTAAAHASANALAVDAITLRKGRSYRGRIRSEDVMLTETCGAADAAGPCRTWRLMPGVS